MGTSINSDLDEQDNKRSLRLWIILGVLLIAGFVAAWQFVGDAPPKRLVVATGSPSGGYAASAAGLRDQLADAGIELEIRNTAGSVENLQLLRNGDVDLAFVQGGVGDGAEDLKAIGSLYFEPMWIFVRDGITAKDLTEFVGLKIEAGGEGSGTRPVTTALLAANGVTEENATLMSSPTDEAIQELVDGACDVIMMVNAATSPAVQRLFRLEGAVPFSMVRAHAASRHFRYLEPLAVTPGMISLAEHLPATQVDIVSPTAGLVAREDLHPAIPPLLIEAARHIHGHGGAFEDQDEFPNLSNLDFEPARAAEIYFRDGPSFLYRVLPFQLAAALDRLKIMLLPLITLLIPLMRIAPPAYRWRIRSKIIRWYRFLWALEERLRESPSEEARVESLSELKRLEDEIRTVRVPLGYAEELYNVRMHLNLVRQELERDSA